MEEEYQQLVDELEEMVLNARRMPLTASVVLDGEALFQLIDRFRQSVPQEIEQATWVADERQQLLAEARAESERMLEEARARAAELVEEYEVTQLAEERAEEILEEAERVAREIRLGARQYADELLAGVETTLERSQRIVAENREELREPLVAATSDEVIQDGEAD